MSEGSVFYACGGRTRCWSRRAFGPQLSREHVIHLEMAKRKLRLSVRIPPYQPPRNAWRRTLHELLSAEAERASVSYVSSDKLQLKIVIYMPEADLSSQDFDNRLKDIMDALQGRAGGPKKIRSLKPIIPDDSQVYRVIIEKGIPPPQSMGLGHLLITKHGNV